MKILTIALVAMIVVEMTNGLYDNSNWEGDLKDFNHESSQEHLKCQRKPVFDQQERKLDCGTAMALINAFKDVCETTMKALVPDAVPEINGKVLRFLMLLLPHMPFVW